MNFKKFSLIISTISVLTGCGDTIEDMESAIELYQAAIPFSDENLKTCVDSGIIEHSVTTSKELTTLTCTQPIADVHGLHYFSELSTLDLTNAGMSCAAINEMQIQIIERAGVDEDESITEIIQPAGCFYNQFDFNDPLFKACIGEEIALNAFTAPEQLTYLSCSASAINDIRGIENFPNLVQIDLSATAVPCADLSELGELLPDAVITSPDTCSVSNIAFSDPVQICVDAQVPASGLVLDFEILSCNDPLVIDLMGLELLTSLTSLDLTGTNVDCIELFYLSKVLTETTITKPEQCIITAETPLADLPPFDDPIMAACIYKKGNEAATLVGDIITLNCGATTGVPDKELTSLGGLESLISMTNLIINATKVDDFQPLKAHPSLKNISLFNLKRLDNDDMSFMHQHMTYLTDLNMGGATGMKDYSQFNQMTNLNFLGVANQNLTGVGDLGTIIELTQLKKLNIKANKLTTIDGLHSLTELIELNVTKNSNLSCEQINAFKAAVPAANVIMDQGC